MEIQKKKKLPNRIVMGTIKTSEFEILDTIFYKDSSSASKLILSSVI